MNSIALEASTHKGSEVWSAPMVPWGQARNHNQPYTLFMYRLRPRHDHSMTRITE